MSWEYVEEFYEHLRVEAGLRAGTVAIYRCAINGFLEYLAALAIPSPLAVAQDTIVLYYRIIAEKRGFAGSTLHNKTHAVYTLYQWLKERGMILVNPCPRPQPFSHQRLPRRLPTQDSIMKLYRKLYAAGDRLGPRDYSIIDLAYACGLRRCEIKNLDVDDVCVEDGTLRVRGKGGHERLVPAGKETIKDLQYYIYRIRPKFLKGRTTRALFVTARDGGKRIHNDTINYIFRLLRSRYGAPKTLTTHALRHAFATDLLRNGAPLQDVSKMLGHASFESTKIYTRVLPSDLKRIHSACHPRG